MENISTDWLIDRKLDDWEVNPKQWLDIIVNGLKISGFIPAMGVREGFWIKDLNDAAIRYNCELP